MAEAAEVAADFVTVAAEVAADRVAEAADVAADFVACANLENTFMVAAGREGRAPSCAIPSEGCPSPVWFDTDVCDC